MILTFLKLPAEKRILLLKATLLLAVIRLALWILPFQMLRRLIVRITPSDADSPTTVDYATREVWAVKKASKYLPGFRNCLVQALAAQILLARRGNPAFLCIGVARAESGKLTAHAWLESNGDVILGDSADLSQFKLLSPQYETLPQVASEESDNDTRITWLNP